MADFCDILGLKLTLDPPRQQYRCSWGLSGFFPSNVVCSRTLFVQDANGKPVSFSFDLTLDDALLVLDLDAKQYSCTDFLPDHKSITFHHPKDQSPRTLPIYISDASSLKARAYLDVIGLHPCSRSLLSVNLQKKVRLLTL